MASQQKTHDYIFKICLVGDPEVGKTSLVKRFVLDQFDGDYILTIGAKVMKKTITVNHKGKDFVVSLMVWDVMGQKHFKIIESVAFQNVVGGLVVCDITRRSTFENLEYWFDAVHKITPGIPLVVLANKSDLSESYAFTEDDLRTFADARGVQCVMTSAKSGANVEETFKKVAEHCLRGVIVE